MDYLALIGPVLIMGLAFSLGAKRGLLAAIGVFGLIAAVELVIMFDDRPTMGTVVDVERVFGGQGGDSRQFTIRYAWRGATYSFETSRGILDRMGGLADLAKGDRVPLLIDTDTPETARFDTISGRHPGTLGTGALLIILAAVLTAQSLRSRPGEV